MTLFITDWSIASYQEIFWSIPVEDKLAHPWHRPFIGELDISNKVHLKQKEISSFCTFFFSTGHNLYLQDHMQSEIESSNAIFEIS